MSDQVSNGETPGGAIADVINKRARVRQARDKALVEAARDGDATAFGHLYDEWVDNVYDRAISAGASAAEAREITEQTFVASWRDLDKLKQPAAFGAKVMQVARREVAVRVAPNSRPVPSAPKDAGSSPEDRLSRATNAATAAADHDVATVLRDAANALDDRTREILDLHFRQGLTRNETAAVIGELPDRVTETVTKLPPAIAVLTRARVLWRGGKPEDEKLAAELKKDGVEVFNASAVRTINRFAKDNDRARARSLIGIPPIELYSNIPLADAPAGLKMAVAGTLVTEGVPMAGSSFVKRDDKGDLVDQPKEKEAETGQRSAKSARPGAEEARPKIDKQKAATVAAAALAAERASEAAAVAAAATPALSKKDRRAAAKAEEKAAADRAAVEKAATERAAVEKAAAAKAAVERAASGSASVTKTGVEKAGTEESGTKNAGPAKGGTEKSGAEKAGPDASATANTADASSMDAGEKGADKKEAGKKAAGAAGLAAGAAVASSAVASAATGADADADVDTGVVDKAEAPAAQTDAVDVDLEESETVAGAATLADAGDTSGGAATTKVSSSSSKSDTSTDASSKTGGKAAPGAKGAKSTKAAAAAGATGAAVTAANKDSKDSKASKDTASTTAKPASKVAPAVEDAPQSSRTGMWIGIGAAAVLLVGLVVFAATRGGSNSSVSAGASGGSSTTGTTAKLAPTTTKAPTTTAAVATTVAPSSTVAPATTVVTTTPITVAPTVAPNTVPISVPTTAPTTVPTTQPPSTTSTTTQSSLVQITAFTLGLSSIQKGYTKASAPVLTWKVQSGPGPQSFVTGKAVNGGVCGPGCGLQAPETAPAGSVTICPVPFSVTDICDAPPGDYVYRIDVKPTDGSLPQFAQVGFKIT